MTHTPCPYCRESHEPKPLSYDGFGINSCGMYADRIATFSKSVPEPMRKELGHLWKAAPDLLEVAKAAYVYITGNPGLENALKQAIAKAEGNG